MPFSVTRFLNRFKEYYLRIPIYPLRRQANETLPFEPVYYADTKAQYYLFYPASKKLFSEVLVFIHPGSWTFGSPKQFRFVANALNDLGYDVALLGYRRMPRARYQEIIQDVFSGFCHLKRTLGLSEEDSFIVIGASAGAHLGALLVYDRKMQEKYKLNFSIFKGFCAIAGPLSFDGYMPKVLKRLLSHLFVDKYHMTLGNPILHANRPGTKVLCIHSIRDPLCPFAQSMQFCEKLNRIQEDTAILMKVEDKNLLHSSLISKTFLDAHMPSFQALENWLKTL